MSEKWFAIPGKFRWNTHENPIFGDGLWHIHREGAPERLPVCVVDRGDDHDDATRERAEKIALLIAAAPELYAALEALGDYVESIHEYLPNSLLKAEAMGKLADVATLLAKARGEAR